jgi:hypothetical protein
VGGEHGTRRATVCPLGDSSAVGAPVVRVASVSDEPSNTASEAFRYATAWLTETVAPSEGWVRAQLTDDFSYEDHRRGVNFPRADAESYPTNLLTAWQTGAGRPEFVVSDIVAVRGERFAALVLQIDYGNGMLFESIQVIALDATLTLLQRAVDFDVDDVDGAIAELDGLQSPADAS